MIHAVTVLDAALGLLAAVLAWEWRVARQDWRQAVHELLATEEVVEAATRQAQQARRRIQAAQVWR